MKQIRYGIIGAGHFGAEMARMIHERASSALSAVYSVNGVGAARVREELGCETEDTLEGLLAREDVDAVLVASPNVFHPEQAIAAARAKKHIFCEKPLAFTYKDAQNIIREAEKNGVTLMTGFTMRFYDGFAKMKRMIADGCIGEPLAAFASRVGWDEPKPASGWKKDQGISGGHLFHHIHEIDLLLWMAGPVDGVYAAGGNLIHTGPGMGTQDDLILLDFHFAGGAYGSMESSSLHQIPQHCVKINGTKGGLEADMRTSQLTLWRNGQPVEAYPMFDDPESQAYNISYNQKGPAHGSPVNRPPLTFRTTMPKELCVFEKKLLGEPVEPIYEDLFAGASGASATAVVEVALRSVRSQKLEPVEK